MNAYKTSLVRGQQAAMKLWNNGTLEFGIKKLMKELSIKGILAHRA